MGFNKGYAFNKFIMGTLSIVLGVFMLFVSDQFLSTVVFLNGCLLLLNSLFKLIDFFKQKKAISMVRVVIYFLAGMLHLYYPTMPALLFAFAFLFYCLALAVVHGINYFMLKKGKVKGYLMELFLFVFYMGFVIVVGLSPLLYMDLILEIIAIYMILYGLMNYKDLLQCVIPISKQDDLKRRIRISLPVFLQAILPRVMLTSINEFLKPTEMSKSEVFSEHLVERKADLEIFVHVSFDGYSQIGHVDLCIEDDFMTYGNYDSKSRHHLELFGDGVLIHAKREEYIPFVIEDSNKALFCYGISLSKTQKESVQKYLREMKKNLISWIPEEFKKNPPYERRILNVCPSTEMFKFKKGKFKNYFILSTNCVLLADEVVGKAGIDQLKMNGIITPGAYYEYLENAFQLKKDFIVYKKIYR